jgi:hypothetical protein
VTPAPFNEDYQEQYFKGIAVKLSVTILDFAVYIGPDKCYILGYEFIFLKVKYIVVLSCVSAQNIVIHDIMSLSNLTVP